MMQMRKETTVSRDVPAREIPSGTPILLKAGDPVIITQSLGGSYTVMTPVGFLARVEGKDADAIGEPIVAADAAAQEGKAPEELAWDQLRTCYDPEIPVNIVDLGLVYGCAVTPLEGGGNRIDVKFTLTAPGCGMGDVLREDIQSKLLTVPGITEADVQVVFDPPWSLQMMSDAAKLQLGMM
jgi:probable FeS assembly SUF system protein SufT